MSNTSALRAGDRVLVTRLNYLGDVVLSLPLVDAIRREHAGVEIDYLARDPGAALLRGDPRFARVIAWPDGAGAALATMKSVRGRGYRAVIDLYSNPRSAWVSWVSGATIRIGGDRRGRRFLRAVVGHESFYRLQKMPVQWHRILRRNRQLQA